MNTMVPRGVVNVLLMLFTACGSSGPTSPTGTNQLPALPSPTPRPATNFPPLSGPSRIFVFERALAFPVSEYTKKSRFVLYDNGAFVLQYPTLGEGGYRGRYEEAHNGITFDWEGRNTAGPWGATGTLEDGKLIVQYNQIMQWSDFEDAVYALTP